MDTPDDAAVEIVASIMRMAERDADLVAAFLSGLGITDVCLPADLLHDLSAVLCCRAWEQCGISIHTDAGFADADTALDAIVSSITEHGAYELRHEGIASSQDVMVLQLRHLTWATSNVVLNDIDDDQLLDELVELLWSTEMIDRTGSVIH